MAGVTESNNWSSEVYRFETEDVVEGGEDGLDNLPGKQLAGRTNWLRLMISAICAAEGVPVVNDETTQLLTALDSRIGNAISALVDSSPAALDTLNELAAALGDDPNFATTVTNALALKAPLASPALTGTPTAPTAPAGTNNTQIATTAFVNSVLATPPATETVAGKAEIATQAETDAGADDARIVTSLKLKNGFSINLAANGYIKFPSWLGGFILQWISSDVTISAEGDQLINLPMTFPNAGFGAFAITRISSANSAQNTFMNFRAISTSQVTFYHQGAPSSPSVISEGYRGFAWGY